MTPLYHTEVKSVAIRGDLWKNDVQSSKDDLNSFWERDLTARACRHPDTTNGPKKEREPLNGSAAVGYAAL